MATSKSKIAFDHKGIGRVLSENRLTVPINQRSYAWEEQHVLDLFQDFASAIASDERDYFLGTIVLTQGEDGLEVADGQQRLATVTILVAAIRDYLFSQKNEARANAITNDFLLKVDVETEETLPQLRLNVDDHEFFRRTILVPPNSPERGVEPTKPSHRRLQMAASLAAERVEAIVAPYSQEEGIQHLVRWLKFIRDDATAIQVTVPDHINAFTMFETLNDRGLRAAQSDILKNFLFSRAKDRLKEVQPRWSAMIGALETVSDDDLAVTYIRHFWITQNGPTKERELSKKIKDTIGSKQKAVDFAVQLAQGANDYAALLNTNHEKWNEYGTSTRKHIEIISHQLRVEQIRPLMFAVARHFSIKEARKAFRLFVSWSVRFLVVGGRGGLLDRNYSVAAEQVGTGKITTAKGLEKLMADVVPSDAEFETAFSTARVSQNQLARYYLRALELQVSGEEEPELVPNDAEDVINLEHIIPSTPSDEWTIDPEMASALNKRLGNMVLLQATANVAAGNDGFAAKKPTYKKSKFALTVEVAKHSAWGLEQISERQKRLAKLATKTWPIVVA